MSKIDMTFLDMASSAFFYDFIHFLSPKDLMILASTNKKILEYIKVHLLRNNDNTGGVSYFNNFNNAFNIIIADDHEIENNKKNTVNFNNLLLFEHDLIYLIRIKPEILTLVNKNESDQCYSPYILRYFDDKKGCILKLLSKSIDHLNENKDTPYSTFAKEALNNIDDFSAVFANNLLEDINSVAIKSKIFTEAMLCCNNIIQIPNIVNYYPGLYKKHVENSLDNAEQVSLTKKFIGSILFIWESYGELRLNYKEIYEKMIIDIINDTENTNVNRDDLEHIINDLSSEYTDFTFDSITGAIGDLNTNFD